MTRHCVYTIHITWQNKGTQVKCSKFFFANCLILELLKNADKTTNIQKPPVYKQILPRVLETTTSNEHRNNRDKNIKMQLSPPPIKQKTELPVYRVPSNINLERQSRVDRILEKYRRQPSNSVSRQFSRSYSCNETSTKSALSTEPNQQHASRTATFGIEESKPKLDPLSAGPSTNFDHSDLASNTISAHQENKNNVTDSLLTKSYSLKSLGEYRARTLGSVQSLDHKWMSKPSNDALVNNEKFDDDPPSSSSSSSTTTTSKSVVSREDYSGSLALLDWSTSNFNEETVSDRIKRRSYYVKLK